MDDKRTRTLKRLVKKLSALRHTLSKSERELLDTLILGAPAEVAGHAIPGAVPGAIPGAVPGAVPGAIPGEHTEVMGHAIPGAVPGAIPGAVPGAIPGAVPGA